MIRDNGDERLLKLPLPREPVGGRKYRGGGICSKVRYIQNIRYITVCCGTYAGAFRLREVTIISSDIP